MRPNMRVWAICLISAAAFAACQPAPSLDAVAATPATNAVQPKKAVAKADAKSPVVSNTVVKDSNAVAKDAVPASAPVTESRPVEAKLQEGESISTTITGCLKWRDDGMFQLKDTDGAHAPKSRSWKSGFIRRGSATIDLFDPGNRLQLGTHAGYRVAISGTLTDREMRARSLSATSARCD
jgi:hypothetical protein